MHNLFTEFSTKMAERSKRKAFLAKKEEQSNVLGNSQDWGENGFLGVIV